MRARLAISLVAVGAACTWIGWLWRGAAATPIPPDIHQFDSLARRLDGIEDTLAAIQGRIASPSDAAAAPVRVADRTANGADAELSVILDKLNATLAALDTQPSRGDRPRDPVLPATRKNVTAIERAISLQEQDGWSSDMLHHFCWTPSQIYEAYGFPDELINNNNTAVWGYRLGEDRGIWFSFLGGVVYNVQPKSPIPPPSDYDKSYGK